MKTLIVIFFLYEFVLCQHMQAVSQDSVSSHLVNALKSARSQSALVKGNVFFPDSTIINKNRVDPKNIKDKNIFKNAQQWLMNFLIPSSCYNIDSLLFLTNMSNGDDWIIKRGWNHGIMFQLVDAREITLLIQKTIDISDSSQGIKQIDKVIRDFLYVYTREIKINYVDSVQIEASYCFKNEDNNLLKQRISLWTDGFYIVVTIPKLRYPHFDLMGLSVELSIGGIALDNPEPFYRFRDSNNYVLKKELYRVYPWIDDSLKSWSDRDIGDCNEMIIGKHGLEINDTKKNLKKR